MYSSLLASELISPSLDIIRNEISAVFLQANRHWSSSASEHNDHVVELTGPVSGSTKKDASPVWSIRQMSPSPNWAMKTFPRKTSAQSKVVPCFRTSSGTGR